MNDLHFAVTLSSASSALANLRPGAAAADASGFDLFCVTDHPYMPGVLDTLTLIGGLLAETSRIRFITNVANLPLRPAPMLAKAAATLDILSGGRFELGLGAGRLWDQITGLGGPRWGPAEAYAAMNDAIDALRAMWQPGNALDRPSGRYAMVGVEPGPIPAHSIGIWLGVGGPRMLDLLGTKADGWIAPILTSLESKPPAQDRIDAAALAAGRQPSDIRRMIQLIGAVTESSETTSSRPRSGPNTHPIHATVQDWAQIIGEFVVDERFDTVNFVPDVQHVEQITRFGEEVIPAARAAASARAEATAARPMA